MLTADLKGKVALVTGGASGIGLATVRLLATCGATVAINDLPNSKTLEQAIHDLSKEGLDVISAPADMSDTESVNNMMDKLTKQTGRLDFLVNNAATPGTTNPIPIDDMDTTDDAFWNKLVSVNLIGPFRCVRAARPWLNSSGGAVVNVASTAAFGGGGSSIVYAATKAALVNMTRDLARGLGPNIRVNAIAPGYVTNSGWDCGWDDEHNSAAADELPLKRLGQPSDYAETILFFCAGARYVTGQTLIVDGGLMA